MSIDVTSAQDGGVLKEILTPGEGEEKPAAGCKVKAHYHGTLEDGTVFDSSVERGQPFEFTLGKGQVIKAWDLGVATMTKGEKARLTCQAKYAYGAQGSPPKIPGGATLIFDITLISWEEEDLSKSNDGGILRSIIEAGSGYGSPAEFRLCKVNLKGSHEGRVFDERELSFSIGEGSELGIPSGVEMALTKMQQGERCRVTLAPKYGWPTGCDQYKIPPNATLRYEITLQEFEKDKESWDMDSADKLKEAALLKNKATEYFQKGILQPASKLYAKAAEYIEKGDGFNESEEEERKKTLLALRLNSALVHLKLKEEYAAKQACDQALEIDQNNVKGLFRRAQALVAMSEPEEAKKDLDRLLAIEPANAAAKTLIADCKKKIAAINAREKQIYANMFEKFATKDKEAFHYGWWDDDGKQPVVKDVFVLPNEKELAEERKRQKKKQLEHLKKVAEQKRKEREEAEALAKEGKTPDSEEGKNEEDGQNETDREQEEGEGNEDVKKSDDDMVTPNGTESSLTENQQEPKDSLRTETKEELIGTGGNSTPPDSTG